MTWWEPAAAAAGSFVAAYLGAAVGLVLGTLRLPLVVLLAGNPATAAGTSITVSAAGGRIRGLSPAFALEVALG